MMGMVNDDQVEERGNHVVAERDLRWQALDRMVEIADEAGMYERTG